VRKISAKFLSNKDNMDKKVLTIPAELSNLDDVLGFIEEAVPDISMKIQTQLAIAVEEIFVNIANYAYPGGIGDCIITALTGEDEAVLTFEDKGIPYNPLDNKDPDTTLSAEERQIGGLGILMAKKLTDGITYSHSEGKNILTIKKRING
jgi:anti-sigma regulatory factor (Ser/Thr protein kinase)